VDMFSIQSGLTNAGYFTGTLDSTNFTESTVPLSTKYTLSNTMSNYWTVSNQTTFSNYVSSNYQLVTAPIPWSNISGAPSFGSQNSNGSFGSMVLQGLVSGVSGVALEMLASGINVGGQSVLQWGVSGVTSIQGAATNFLIDGVNSAIQGISKLTAPNGYQFMSYDNTSQKVSLLTDYMRSGNASIRLDGTSNIVAITSGSNSASNVVLSQSGNYFCSNIGIGTSNSTYGLTLGGACSTLGVDNAGVFYAKNTSNAYEAFMYPRYNDNIMYINAGSAGLNVRNNGGTTTMFMSSNNNVGIGTLTPAYKLDLYGDLHSYSGYFDHQPENKSIVNISTPKIYNNSFWYKIANVASVSSVYCKGTIKVEGTINNIQDGQKFSCLIHYQTAGTGGYNAQLETTYQSTDFWGSGGFDIVGYVDNNHNLFLYMKLNGGYILANVNATVMHWDGAGVTLYPNTNYNIAFSASNSVLMAADTSLTSVNHSFSVNSIAVKTTNYAGNIGIGTTPAYKLDVNGAINTNNTLSASNAMISGNLTASNNAYVTSTNTFQTVFQLGNTTSHNYQFLVGGSTNSNIYAGVGGLAIYDSTISAWRLNITSTGQVGINNTNPQYQLDVAGTINTNNTLTASNITVSGTMTSPTVSSSNIVATGGITTTGTTKTNKLSCGYVSVNDFSINQSQYQSDIFAY